MLSIKAFLPAQVVWQSMLHPLDRDNAITPSDRMPSAQSTCPPPGGGPGSERTVHLLLWVRSRGPISKSKVRHALIFSTDNVTPQGGLSLVTLSPSYRCRTI